MNWLCRIFGFWVILLSATVQAADTGYEFHGEGQSLLSFMEAPPHGTNYCSPRFYINQQSIVYAWSYKPGPEGLEEGDKLLAINGILIDGPQSLPTALESLNSKDVFKLRLLRDGEIVELTRACSDDTQIDKTITSLARALIAEDWDQCRTLIKQVEQHEQRAEWINIRLRCNYMYAKKKNNLDVYWNRDWPYDTYQYYSVSLSAASFGSVEELDAIRPEVIKAISDLSRNRQRMYSGDLRNEFDNTIKIVDIRNGLAEPDTE